MKKERLHLLNEQQPGSQWFAWFVCLLTTVFYCYEYLLRIVPSVMSSQLMQHFHIGVLGFGWLSNAYLISYTAMQLFVGPAIDFWGLRRMMLLALISCVLGSVLFGVFDSFIIAFVGRLFIGFGSSFAFVGVLRMASIWLPNRYFSFFSGFTTALGMAGAMVGDMVLVHFVKSAGWKDVVYFTASAGVLLLPLFYWFLVDKKERVNQAGRVDEEMFRKIAVVIKNRRVIIAGAIGSFMFCSLCVFADIWGIRYIQTVFHFSAEKSAQINSFLYLGWLIGAPLVGLLSEYYKTRRWFLFGGCFGGALVFLCILYLPLHSSFTLSLLMLVFGMLCGAEILCFSVGKDSVTEHYTATAIGMVNFVVMLGGMILLPVVSYVVESFFMHIINHGVKVYSVEGYQYAMTLISIGLFVAAMLSLKVNDDFDPNKE